MPVLLRAVPTLNLTIALLFVTTCPWKGDSFDSYSCFLMCWNTCDPLQTARLFGPAIFEASKLRVLFLGSDKEHPDRLPRIYTLTHSDVTSKITLAVSREINKAQVGTYSRCMAYLNTCSLRFHKNHLLF